MMDLGYGSPAECESPRRGVVPDIGGLFMKMLLSLILVLMICVLPPVSFAEEAGTVSEDYEPIWQLAEPYGFRFGGAFSILR